jgi:hypothetical protein
MRLPVCPAEPLPAAPASTPSSPSLQELARKSQVRLPPCRPAAPGSAARPHSLQTEARAWRRFFLPRGSQRCRNASLRLHRASEARYVENSRRSNVHLVQMFRMVASASRRPDGRAGCPPDCRRHSGATQLKRLNAESTTSCRQQSTMKSCHPSGPRCGIGATLLMRSIQNFHPMNPEPD